MPDLPDPSERIALLETMLAALIDHVDQVGYYNRFGERLGDQGRSSSRREWCWAMRRGACDAHVVSLGLDRQHRTVMANVTRRASLPRAIGRTS